MRAFILFILIFDATFRREKDNISKSFLHTNVVAKRSLIHFKALALPTYIMIRKNTLFCKLIRIKSSSKSLFNSFMDGFCPELQTCPCCGTKGDCQILAYYDRSLVDFINGVPVCHSLCIMRLICTCGHTHAVLPDFIIPYVSYGLFFILRTLAEYFLHICIVEKLCDRFFTSRFR